MTREHAKVPERVEPRREHCGHKPSDELVRLEYKRPRAVAPRALELELVATVVTLLESLVGERRAHHVAGEPLDAASVIAVHRLLGVHVDAADFGDGRGVVGCACGGVGRDEQTQRGAAGAVPVKADTLRGSPVAGGKARLIADQRGR
jgi:hypothetical protein